MRVLHVARECVPLAKAGGLADVVGALPQAAAALPGGPEAAVLLPEYDSLRARRGREVAAGSLTVQDAPLRWRVSLAAEGTHDVPLYLVQSEAFEGPSPYGGDELLREAALSAAALHVGQGFDVVHVHDHHAALATTGLAGHPPPRPVVLTVHNARYHGALDWDAVESLGLPGGLQRGSCDHDGQFNRLKAALLHAGVVTTVSPSHAGDLLEHAEASLGLDYAFRMARPKLTGILNGIDTGTWDPATDPHLQARYSAADLSGKRRQKELTCAEAGLDPGGPLLAFVGRLVPEKGVDALLAGLPLILDAHPGAQALVLGTGEPRYEQALVALQAQRSPRVALAMVHDERFAHRLYAAADLLLMPSWHEPCGLSQMYAMRYGTVPVVYPTGGLRDTVVPFDGRSGTGAWMDAPTPEALAEAASRAIGWLQDERARGRLLGNAMAAYHGWSASAAHYVAAWRRAAESR